jgi:hypothetical protein
VTLPVLYASFVYNKIEPQQVFKNQRPITFWMGQDHFTIALLAQTKAIDLTFWMGHDHFTIALLAQTKAIDLTFWLGHDHFTTALRFESTEVRLAVKPLG